MSHLDAPAGLQALAGVVLAAVTRLGGAEVQALRGGTQGSPGGTYQVGIYPVGPADKGLQPSGAAVGEPQECPCPGAGPIQQAILELGPQVAEGNRAEPLLAGGLGAERGDLQQGAMGG